MIELYKVRVARGAESSPQTSEEDVLHIRLSESEGISDLPPKLLKTVSLSIREFGVELFAGGFCVGRRLNYWDDKIEDGDILYAVVRPFDMNCFGKLTI